MTKISKSMILALVILPTTLVACANRLNTAKKSPVGVAGGTDPLVSVLQGCGQGVPGSAHVNPDKSKGGFVADSAAPNVDQSATIGPNASVCGTAHVLRGAKVLDNSVVAGNATVADAATVVSGYSSIEGDANVHDGAIIQGAAPAQGQQNLIIGGEADISGSTVKDNAQVYGLWSVYISDSSTISGDAIIDGDAQSMTDGSGPLTIQCTTVTGSANIKTSTVDPKVLSTCGETISQ